MKNFFTKLKEKNAQRKEKELMERAKDLFQICEHDGETWITYGGHLVLPTEFLREDPITTLQQLREAYIERNKA